MSMQFRLYRLGHWLFMRGAKRAARAVQWTIFLIYGAVVPSEAEIGEGTVFAHGMIGTVIHPRARIGCRVLIAHGVTIGGRSRQPGTPVIEDDVYIAPGAKILGDVRIGRDSLIGANAVVLSSVPPGSLVVGVPGVVKRSGIRARDLEDW